MLAREWRRLRQTYAWQPVGGLAILLLLAGLVLDTLWGDYATVAQRLENTEAELAVMRMKAERLPALEAKATQIAAEYGGIQSRLIPAQDGAAAGDKFGEILRNWYGTKGITQVSVREVERREVAGLVYYRVSLDAAMQLEQLVDLLQSIPFAPVSVGLVEAVISGNDEQTPTGLRALMRWEGLLAPASDQPQQTESVAGAAKKKGGEMTRGETSGRKATEAPVATKTIEEKRK